jgi:hypothetical protein
LGISINATFGDENHMPGKIQPGVVFAYTMIYNQFKALWIILNTFSACVCVFTILRVYSVCLAGLSYWDVSGGSFCEQVAVQARRLHQ